MEARGKEGRGGARITERGRLMREGWAGGGWGVGWAVLVAK